MHTHNNTLTHKLHTHIPHTIVKYIANYIKGRKAYTTFRNKTSTQRQFKNGVPQGGVLSPTLFNIYTSDTPTPQAPVKLTPYADDITITSTHNDINHNITLPMNINPKMLGLTLDPKHIEITTTKARKTIHIRKELTSTTWGKQK